MVLTPRAWAPPFLSNPCSVQVDRFMGDKSFKVTNIGSRPSPHPGHTHTHTHSPTHPSIHPNQSINQSIKASGFRPALRVIRELANARSVLDRLNLDEPGPYIARVVRTGR